MNPNNPVDKPQAPNFFSGGSDVPPPPSTNEPAANMPPPALIAEVPQSTSPITPPVSSDTMAPPPPSQSSSINVSTIPPRRGIPKKIFILVLLLILGLSLVAFLLKSGLPMVGGGKTTITWWGLWEDASVVDPLIAEYTQQNKNVEIKYVPNSKEQYRERLTNALAQGNGPDIFRYHNSWVPMFRSRLSPLPASVMTSQEFAQTFYPVAVSSLTSQAGIVGIPLMYDGLGLYINDEIFATYGKTTPVTWYELRDTAVELTIRDEKGAIKQAGAAIGRTENVDNWQDILALMMIQNGVNMNTLLAPSTTGQTTSTGGGTTSVMTTDYAEQALKFFTAFSTTYKVWDETLPSSTAAFANGKVAMIIAPSWRAHEIRALKPDLKFHVVAAPQLPKINPDEPDITYASFWAEGVSSQSKVSEESWKFLKFLSTKESLEKLYANASSVRAFGELYPRRDMQQLLLSDPLVSGILQLAGNAKSWYLASRTFDGQTGINSALSKYFEDAINTVTSRSGGDAKNALSTAAAGVTQVLVQYGLVTPPPAPVK